MYILLYYARKFQTCTNRKWCNKIPVSITQFITSPVLSITYSDVDRLHTSWGITLKKHLEMKDSNTLNDAEVFPVSKDLLWDIDEFFTVTENALLFQEWFYFLGVY